MTTTTIQTGIGQQTFAGGLDHALAQAPRADRRAPLSRRRHPWRVRLCRASTPRCTSQAMRRPPRATWSPTPDSSAIGVAADLIQVVVLGLPVADPLRVAPARECLRGSRHGRPGRDRRVDQLPQHPVRVPGHAGRDRPDLYSRRSAPQDRRPGHVDARPPALRLRASPGSSSACGSCRSAISPSSPACSPRCWASCSSSAASATCSTRSPPSWPPS